MSLPFSSHIDLPEEPRTLLIALLNARLADAVDLQTHCKQAHWNVKGPHFISLHKLFDDLNEDVEDYVDDLAERIVQLGGVAEGTARLAAQRSTLPPYPLVLAEGLAHVAALTESLAVFGRLIRQAIDSATAADDADTADLFTEISRGVDKWLWFVEAHLQASR